MKQEMVELRKFSTVNVKWRRQLSAVLDFNHRNILHRTLLNDIISTNLNSYFCRIPDKKKGGAEGE